MKQSLRYIGVIWMKLALLTVAVGTLLRVVLLFNEQTTSLGFTVAEWLKIFFVGAVNDIAVSTLAFVFLMLFTLSCGERKFSKPWGYILLGVLVAALGYVGLFNTIFDEYGSVVPRIAIGVLSFWTLSFALRLFLPSIRAAWRKVWLAVFLVAYVGATVFNLVSEYTFWSEFGVRYNFIAVDYLIYTNEVVGNIRESYPILPMASGIIIVTLAIAWTLFRSDVRNSRMLSGWQWKVVAAPAYIVTAVAAVALLGFNLRFQTSGNVYVNELQANGLHRLYDAFVKNSLSYEDFYITRPETEAEAFIHATYDSTGENLQQIESDSTELRHNIVLITLESMSASYLERFGNTDGLTPTLDSLYNHSLAFDRMYATGNRTVRGLEAVTLSLPPCPGQSIIKRPENSGMHSTGAMLGAKGYEVTYFYGGDSYFDNMEQFFSGNGYKIVDKGDYAPEEITFSNIWGVCDEDAYRKVIKTLDSQAQDNKPFFAHILSVSNHRPFTYPAGRISIPHDAKSRKGGVMYSDHALGEFFREAAHHEWFDDTIFVISADHCASSAGKTEIPLQKYHIPALIYAPKLIEPHIVGHTVSQIDIMPTLFDIMGFGYESHFFGRSVFDEGYVPRAFIATYQDLGYLEGDTFTILSPVRRSEQYRVVPTEDNPHNTEPLDVPDEEQISRAVYYYQTSSAWNMK